MTDRRDIALLVAVFLLLAAAAAPTVAATHNPTLTSQCTYELGVHDYNGAELEDPIGLTSDGSLNWNQCFWHFPDSTPGENQPLGPLITSGKTVISGEYSTAQAVIVDDVWGSGLVGGSIAVDYDGNYGFGEEGEPLFNFCGTSPTFSADRDSDGDGHDDFGWGMLVHVFGTLFQTMNCDPVQAPTGTTGGILNPHGGAYVIVE